MARPREFEEERAIEAAMRAFWSAGYEGTSTQDLCEATGLGRSSIYNTFKSKHDLFDKALRRYMDSKTASLMELLEGELPVREKVRALLWQAVDVETGDPVGCLVVNSLVELAPRDPEVAEQLRRDGERRLGALRAAFELGQSRGELEADRDPAALAHFVVAAISGMRVMARGGSDREALESVAKTTLDALL
ncbi:TetR/AcrR family transcriptional regulator [Nonomuraea aurantiaca]|jgi:AcrR family transcriptional regulator|uniref:TetR/AcrR family transcriptional regulator n=1 Tax=Nonomuraea aurantiaca TaxID=2878562 RepID=UPI001CDA25E2|nr:TetR/AcrR family transcriptional regulator [Nonomuraea aurantiaca]MCA2224268.1 TetR/AcrR family transcriptional regulator [Nonomuraea aurantiaca]